MQQVTIEHIYPEFAETMVLYLDHQREGIVTISDAIRGEFAEDATVLWETHYLNYVKLAVSICAHHLEHHLNVFSVI